MEASFEFVRKPYDTRDLDRALQRALDQVEMIALSSGRPRVTLSNRASRPEAGAAGLFGLCAKDCP
jgi:hypothetical protein